MEDINLIPPGIVTLLLILVGTLTLLSRVNLSINAHFQRVVRNISVFKRMGLPNNSITHFMFIMVSYMWVLSIIISYLYRIPATYDTWSMTWLTINLGISIALAFPLTLVTLFLIRERVTQKPVIVEKQEEVNLPGRLCHVTSNIVNERIGEAKLSDDGEAFKVRCQPGEVLHKGDVALIVEFDDQQKLYWVEPYSDPFA